MAASNKNLHASLDAKENAAKVFVTCPAGLEQLLAEELTLFLFDIDKVSAGGVYCRGNMQAIYRACLWSRLANRVLLAVGESKINTAQELYHATQQVKWQNYFSAQATLLIHFLGSNKDIRNSHFGALTVKDGIVDQWREATGIRPSIDKNAPDVRIHVRLAKGRAIFSIDMAGDSLHKRGYRVAQGEAPLKENLAAALLMRADWPVLVAAQQAHLASLALIDPMCGSGTFLIEGAQIAANIAPGLTRKHFGFEKLNLHSPNEWQGVLQEAQSQRQQALEQPFPEIRGYDIDPKILDAATANIEAAGLQDVIRLSKKNAADFKKPTHTQLDTGLLICNPPYGERLGEIESLRGEYRTLGQVLKAELPGWQAAIFTGNAELAKEMRLRPKRKYKFFNGNIPSELLLYDIIGSEAQLREDANEPDEEKEAYLHSPPQLKPQQLKPQQLKEVPLNDGATMVANRLKKNIKSLRKWVESNAIECYRVYDADMPEYSAAIDVYGNYFHVQEYQAPKSIDEKKAEQRFEDLTVAIAHVFDCEDAAIVTKQRRRNRGNMQYEKLGRDGQAHTFTVTEGKACLEINLWDYLDSGLFLDHRPLRLKIARESFGKQFLNLFCYTASATVHAALGGAAGSVSVDMSATYIEWARRNFDINKINPNRHTLVNADCLQWLRDCRQGFDLIMLDPPSFSNSKKMHDVLDVQRDHVTLIKRCMELLNPGGVLYFSTNLRSFKLDVDALSRFNIRDISADTLDPDFVKNPKIHYCWEIHGLNP